MLRGSEGPDNLKLLTVFVFVLISTVGMKTSRKNLGRGERVGVMGPTLGIYKRVAFLLELTLGDARYYPTSFVGSMEYFCVRGELICF